MTVGNFKRQAPIRHVPLQLPPNTVSPEKRLRVPGHDISLVEDDPQSWATFEKALMGFGIATTTTLLSALWPRSYCVIDRFAFGSAVGLRAVTGHASRDGGLMPDGVQRVGDLTWRDYEDYRRWVFRTAQGVARPATAVERILYNVRVADDRTRTWRHFGEEFLRHAGRR